MEPTEIKIDSDIPLARTNRGQGGGVLATARKLEVGQSFIIPDDVKTRRQFACLANRTLNPKRFASRTTLEGTRIWRTA